MTNQTKPINLSFKFKIIWGLASFGGSLISGIFGGMQVIFYQDYLGLNAKWIIIAASIYAIWNAINDPLFGFITDNTRSKRGRRVPYMRFTAPFLGLFFILVWFVPNGWGQIATFFWMLVTMLLYDTAYTIVFLVYSALLPEITESDSQRADLQVSSSLLSLVGTIFGFLIPDLVRPKAGATSLLPFRLAMIGIALICTFLIIYTTLNIKERKEFLLDKPLPFWEMIKKSLTNKSFLIVAFTNFMSILMQSLCLGMIYYMSDYVVKSPSVMPLLLAIFLPLIVGVPIASYLSKKIGVSKAQQILMVIGGVGLIASTFVPPNLLIPFIILAGLGLSGPLTLTNILFAQVADEDELNTGTRREGAFFGINALIVKPAQSLAMILPAQILTATHFITRESNAGLIELNQPAQAVFGIKALFGLIPGVALLIGALLLILYPLKGVYLEEVKDKVLELHVEKKKKMELESSS